MSRKLNLITATILTLYTSFTLVDTFMLQHSGTAIATSTKQVKTTVKKETSSVKTTATSYEDSHMKITVDDPSLLQTALANNTYGRNYTETTSSMASDHQAIFAINGDYYGFRDTGYVVRNGTLYRDTAAADTDALVIDSDGNMKSVNQTDTSASTLLKDGAQQVLSFGPTLVENSKVTVSESEEVGQSQASNPRTAIGQVGKNHYIVVVSDGRTSESTGLSLYQLANVMADHGATYAYNLDGGGSSTMVLNGKVINNPVGGSGQSSERAVSDMLYFGYAN